MDRYTLLPAPAPFGHGPRTAVAVVHSVKAVDGPDYPWTPRSHWVCGGETWLRRATMVDSPPEGWRRCPRCVEALKDSGEPSVYFAERDGLIKIGVSIHPRSRVAGQAAALLATLPGDARTETALHLAFADLRVEGEWFRPGPALLRLIDLLAKRAAKASAA